MAIYQFLIAVRSGGPNQQSFQLTNDAGETTSHIQGMFNRTIRYMTEGIKPVFVFDGKPPQLKSGELLKRREKRQKAEAALKVAAEAGDVGELDKQSKRLVRAGTRENADCQKLLQLMGVPVVLAPCEAEAQAAHLAASGQVYGVGTEDMDALTFKTPILVRKMTFAGASKSLVQTISYEKAIAGLQLTHDQFVDLCILLGCDYCDTIRGVGPKTALKLIREHGSIEQIISKIDGKKFTVPESWLPHTKGSADDSENDEESPADDEHDKEKDQDDEHIPPAYVQARQLFHAHQVLDRVELKWKPCQVPELTQFLVDEMGFSAERVATSIAKLQVAHKANHKPQTRMDAFFQSKPNPHAADQALKRKATAAAANKAIKKKATGKKR